MRWRKRNPFARVRPARQPLYDHERRVLVADLAAIGGQGSFYDFERAFPGRYDPRYFDAAMDRLTPVHVKYRGRERWFGSKLWSLPDYQRFGGDRLQVDPQTRVPIKGKEGP